MPASAAQDLIAFDRLSPLAARKAIRSHGFTGYTAGIAPGYVQANVCILPRAFAEDFLLYCQRNPRPCPLIARSDAGDPRLPALGENLDIRTDIPRYHIFRNGEFVEEATNIRSHWRDDLVTFALGCSFSFEEALLEAGLRLKFLERNSVAGVYITSIETVPAGPFRGAAHGHHARVQAGRRHSRDPDHIALSQCPWRARAHRQAGEHRRRSRAAAIRMSATGRWRPTSCRCSGPAGSPRNWR